MKTHCHGRWIQNQHQRRPVWVDYEQQGENVMFDLPPNVPKSHDHWVGCTLPNGIRVQSIEQVITMMANFRASKSLLFNPSDPMGPLPRQPGTERQPMSRVAEALQIFEAIPEDDRTPVRHGSQYHSLTEEERQEEA